VIATSQRGPSLVDRHALYQRYLQHRVVLAQGGVMMPAASRAPVRVRQRRRLRRQSHWTKTADRRRFVHRALQLVLGQLVKIRQGSHRASRLFLSCLLEISRSRSHYDRAAHDRLTIGSFSSCASSIGHLMNEEESILLDRSYRGRIVQNPSLAIRITNDPRRILGVSSRDSDLDDSISISRGSPIAKGQFGVSEILGERDVSARLARRSIGDSWHSRQLRDA